MTSGGATGKRTAELNGHSTEWKGSVRPAVLSVAFSPDGKTLASGSRDDTIKLWDIASGKNIATLEKHTDSVQSVAFSPDGNTLASGSMDKTIVLWDVTGIVGEAPASRSSDK